MFSGFRRLLLFAVALIVAQSSAWAAALTANTTYLVELAKFNSNGTTTQVTATSATTDASGKLAFSFSNVPTNATANFLLVTVKDPATGAVAIKSFVPAPPANGTNTLGVNTTTTAQADLMVALGQRIGSDDPVAVAFGLMFTRNPNLSPTDISNLAIIAQEAIINGMEGYLAAQGVTAAQLNTFKAKLVYNGAAGATDLRAFTALTRSAVLTPAQAKADMAKASGLIASAFVDAADAAGIDLDLLLAAFDGAGATLSTGPGATAMAALTAAFRSQMLQAVNVFYTRLDAANLKRRYDGALSALGATPAERNRFSTAVNAMTAAMGQLDGLFASYFDGTPGYSMTETLNAAFAAGHLTDTSASATPDAIGKGINAWTQYKAANPAATWQMWTTPGLDPAVATVQNAMDYAYNQAYVDFGTNIASTASELTAMKSAVATALGIAVTSLPTGFGTYLDVNGNTKNWPIPRTVAAKFVATKGGIGYTRTTTTIPANITWLGSCSNTTAFDKQTCTTGGGTWTPARTAFTGLARVLQEIEEDVMIAEFRLWWIWDSANPSTGGNPTYAQQQAARNALQSELSTIANNISGSLTLAQKRALVVAMEPL